MLKSEDNQVNYFMSAKINWGSQSGVESEWNQLQNFQPGVESELYQNL